MDRDRIVLQRLNEKIQDSLSKGKIYVIETEDVIAINMALSILALAKHCDPGERMTLIEEIKNM